MELEGLKKSELNQRARDIGIQQAELDAIEDSHVCAVSEKTDQMQEKVRDSRLAIDESLSEAKFESKFHKVIAQYRALKAYRAEHFPSSTDDADEREQLDREEGAAKTVQRFYRRHRARKKFLDLRKQRTEEEPQRS